MKMEEQNNISGMIPNTINILRDNLRDRYDSGFPILKELIQNANDAGASVLNIYKSDGIKGAVHPLLQKPALLVFNDGVVTDKDLEGIRSVAQGGKTGRTGVIGKFGLGMKSIFHFCDMFFYVALQNENSRVFAVNPYIDLVKGKDTFHPGWNSFSGSDQKLLLSESEKITEKSKDGLLLWIPLRDDSYNFKILKDIYSLKNLFGDISLEQLKKNVSMALVSLEISTPCNGGKRSLETVAINTSDESINLFYKINSDKIISDKKTYCEIIESKPVNNEAGQNLLRELIAKDKFTKISYIDDNGEEQEIASYTEKQNIGIAIAKFASVSNTDISINWCSYLPLNGADDTSYFTPGLDAEYHIVLHANFAIDSGRRNIVNFADCIDKNKIIDIENVNDDKSAQIEWNKILIRYYILPNLLRFVCENTEEKFFTSFYKAITGYTSRIGYFCLDRGIAFKKMNSWKFKNTKSITASGILLLSKTAEYYSDLKSFRSLDLYEMTVKVCNYIQMLKSGISWLIASGQESLTHEDLVAVNKIVCQKNYPVLLLPSEMQKTDLEKFQLNSEEMVIDFLQQFYGENEDKASNVFESMCSNGGISKEISAAVFKNDWIKKYAKLFKISYIDQNNLDKSKPFITEGKTYNEVCEISSNSRLFFFTIHNFAKGELARESFYQYQLMCPETKLYCINQTAAKNQLFLTETDNPNGIVSFMQAEGHLQVLNSHSLAAILYSIVNNLEFLIFKGNAAAKALLYKTSELTDEEKEKYSDALRAILVGKAIDKNRLIFKLNTTIADKEKAPFYYELLCRFGMNPFSGALVNKELDDFPHSLMSVLNIKDIDTDQLERELKSHPTETEEKTTPEEKDKLAECITDEETFKSLCILKTTDGEYVSCARTSYKVFLASEDASIHFPSYYKIPETCKVVARNENVPLQKTCLKELKYEDVINTILLDKDNGLGQQASISLSGFVNEMLSRSRISADKIFPNSRKCKWIPDNSYNFYSLDEIIDYPSISEKTINLCDGIIHAGNISSLYMNCRQYFVNTEETAVKSMLSHPDRTSDNKWPWFNINSFAFSKGAKLNSDFLDYLKYTGDSSVQIVLEVYKNSKDKAEKVFATLKDLQTTYITEPEYLSERYSNFLAELCKTFEAGTKVSDETLTFLEEAFAYVSKTDAENFIERSKNAGDSEIKLPSVNGTWENISGLVNFEVEIPDLPKAHALNKRIEKFLPSIDKRSGSDDNCKSVTAKELIDKLSVCKNKKLWGAFCYCICPKDDQIYLSSHAELIEKNNIEDFERLHLPKIKTLRIRTYKTDDNYCTSLTGKDIKLADAKDIDTVFYNPPLFFQDSLDIEVFDNFSAFTDKSVEDSVKKLFTELGVEIPDEKFFDNLANPSQASIETAVNMIFTNVFVTLKILKLDTRAGANNVIASEYKKYMEACGVKDYQLMEACCESIKHYIEQNSGNIQNQIRERVINYIRDAEYQERCILFELFQNADDAYNQKSSSPRADFKISTPNNSLVIEHSGRPINEYKNGGLPEYKADLTNMLTIGWSDKANLPENQTGKFGYGFKTVYLISDEPYVKSGDYDFVIKAALYPQKRSEESDYTDKTVIELPLNDNGIHKKAEIIDSFAGAAQFLVLFSKQVREISINGRLVSWKPKESVELSKFTVQQDDGILLFKSIPQNINDSQCRYVSFAFKKNGKTVCPFDDDSVRNEDKTPKIWCLAPLNDFKGLNFAINAQFKTNTGRQTLAIKDSTNLAIAQKISKLLIEAIFELKDKEDFNCYIPSLINIVLDADTKTDHFFGLFSIYAIEESLKRNLIPDGTKYLEHYAEQHIYSISAKYFNDHINQQYKIIKEMNDFIKNCGDASLLVTTQLDADLLRTKIVNKPVAIKQVIQILDVMLNKNAGNIEAQKEIITHFNDSPLYGFVTENEEEISLCKLTDSDGQVKMVEDIYKVSDDYGECKVILQSLFKPSRKVSDAQIQAAAQQNPWLFPQGMIQPQIQLSSTEKIFELWKEAVEEGTWDSKVEEYYNRVIPLCFGISDLATLLNTGDTVFGKDTMSEPWCIFVLLAMMQSISIWTHSDTSRRSAVQWLYDKGLITKFCGDENVKGENLQKLYDLYLTEAVNDEDKLPYFEQLLRIYKIRKNFNDFYDLISKLPLKDNFDDISKFLVAATDEDLSGSGIELSASDKSLRLGISFIIRELLRSGFYSQEDAHNKLGKFAYLPSLKIRRIVTQDEKPAFMPSVDIYQSINETIPDDDPQKEDFMHCYDLPFIILGGN